MIEKKKATNRELHSSFIERKAYDSVPLNKVWENLDKSTINRRLIVAKNYYIKDLVQK